MRLRLLFSRSTSVDPPRVPRARDVQVTLRNQRLAVASKKCVLKIAITDQANSKGKERDGEVDGALARVILINHDYVAIMSVVHFASRRVAQFPTAV